MGDTQSIWRRLRAHWPWLARLCRLTLPSNSEQALLLAAIESIPEAVIIFDADERVVMHSRRYAELGSPVTRTAKPGAKVEDMLRTGLARGIYAGISPGDEENWIRARLKQFRADQAQWLQPLCDGTWMQIDARRLPGGGGISIRTDITELVRREEHLRDSEARADAARIRLEEALGALSEGFALYDADDRLVICNARYREIFSLTAPCIVPGARFADLLRASIIAGETDVGDVDAEEFIARRVAMHRNPGTPLERRKLIDGRWLQISERRTAEGGVVCVITEITDLVQREERLRVSEALAAAARAQLEAALAAHSEGFALYDADDRLVIYNDRYRAMFADAGPNIVPGIRFDELIRASVRAIKIDLGDFDREDYIARRTAAHRDPGRPFESRLLDGRWVQISERRTGEGGVVCVVTDVTALKTAEAAMRSAMEQAEQANQAKTRFLAAASHDLRQPLHALGMFVAALEERVRGRETRQIVENVGLTVAALESLLNALLDISKLDAGAVRPEIVDLQLGPLLQRLHAEYVPQARQKGLRFRLVPSAVSVRSDPALLESIVRNLLSNAIRYTARGAVLIGCRSHGASVMLEVRDSGVGIPPDQIANVFREFYRLDEMNGNGAPGAGLGLAIVERIARLLGHRLELQSEPGRGSVFRIELPRIDGAERLHAISRPSELLGDPLRGCSLIVIDDDYLVLESMRRLLEGWGCRVLAVASAEAALADIDTFGAPDLIIADYRLRSGTGPQAIDAIHRRLNVRTPAVIITGETGRGEPGDMDTAGLVVLRKPVAPAKLRSLLSHSLRQTLRESTSA